MFRLFQIRHRFGCYDQVTEVNRLRVRYCNWVRFLKITQQHHSEQHVNVLGTKIKGIHTSTTGSICVFISPKYVFIIIYFYSRRLRDYIRVSCRTCSRFNTVCGFMVGSCVSCVWEPRRKPCVSLHLFFFFFINITFFLFGFNRRTHVRSDQKHTRQHGVNRALPARTAGRNIFHASCTLFKKYSI